MQHYYAPAGACKELFESRESEVLVSGPAGTGKSRACLEKLNLMCLMNPGMKALIVRKTAVSLASTAMATYRRFVVNEAISNGIVTAFGGSAFEPAQFRYSNGSTVVLAGMDKSTRIMSSEYDIVYVQEATELAENDWEALTTRLRNHRVSFQQIIADCNPDTPTHWLKRRTDDKKTKLLESRHEDNPVLFNPDGSTTTAGSEYLAKLDALTGVRYQRLRRGIWAAAEGLIYEGYDPAIHLITGFLPPREWTRIWTVDFGYTNPFVCQFWAIDPDGRMHLYKEIYKTKTLVEDHAKVMLAMMDRRPDKIVCDHDAEDRATLERHLKMPTVAAKKTVSDGIQATAIRLRVLEDGKPRVYFHRDTVKDRDQALIDAALPTSTIEEITGYVWDQGAGKAPKEAPLKRDDHGMDGWRYGVMELDLGRKPRYRSFTV